eukprot:3839368-Ditylum_brightwellii.AAC.2
MHCNCYSFPPQYWVAYEPPPEGVESLLSGLLCVGKQQLFSRWIAKSIQIRGALGRIRCEGGSHG